VGSLLCVSLYCIREIYKGVWVLVLLFEHAPACGGGSVVVVVVVDVIRGIRVAKGCARAVWKDERKVGEGSG